MRAVRTEAVSAEVREPGGIPSLTAELLGDGGRTDVFTPEAIRAATDLLAQLGIELPSRRIEITVAIDPGALLVDALFVGRRVLVDDGVGRMMGRIDRFGEHPNGEPVVEIALDGGGAMSIDPEWLVEAIEAAEEVR